MTGKGITFSSANRRGYPLLHLKVIYSREQERMNRNESWKNPGNSPKEERF